MRRIPFFGGLLFCWLEQDRCPEIMMGKTIQ
ncbi:hypothetical protein AFE_3140 [Acidithiobacillus ferrooxidans ATCC 23270]|uniref:Uncharacterized protein n=1 Tax=Acidithiobacillus ferrooxidans (strain ATCC 23270 / DSM 14882 / CIP 104768 / NCIMB 8455) TaxID=243159 RepID=B7JAP4_ACIF2|nr:hypothetical protein AFE_3140 [Acidithiobacillus ferrooxidans ATCC 23270]